MTTLVLVRHGESNVTVNRIIGGVRTCTGLSPLGVQQAQRLRDRLARTGELEVDSLICSSMSRARQTAEILAPVLGAGPPVVDPDWCEQDPGECDGMSFADYVAQYGRPQWGLDTEVFKGGETLRRFQKRIHDVVDRTQAPDRTLMVVCHGGVIDATLRYLLQLPAVGQVMFSSTNTSLTQLRRVGEIWQVMRYNDAAHLEGLPAETSSATA
jgi:broad specificity phosphatase PhoE